ncbi:glycosyltransferase family 2 protein [Salinibacter sp.]|uniref:glycosyltransferase family 2 protein n=1 Tax=Salinibacter sp. TaxID=2065818 RepID=UPI0021E9731A|nr:glycosyltransferase family A protein [Salinibacter sp.]
MYPLVSILIPCYNAEPWLGQTLESALEQTWPETEIIVVDDGSTDQSLDIARSFEQRGVTVVTQKNRGACVARNRALQEAKGDYIQFLDADDLLDPNKIKVQMHRLLNEDSGVIASAAWERLYEASGDVGFEDINLHFRDRPFYTDYDSGIEWTIDAVQGKDMFPPHAWLVPRTVVEIAGLWDESLLINQDGEYFNRVVLASDGIVFCSDARVYYRSGLEGSISGRQSPKVIKSKYDSINQITQRILAEEDSPRTREACATAFQDLAHYAYPEVPKVVEKALGQVEKLGGVNRYLPSGSKHYQILCEILGWKTAKRLKRWYYRVRYGKTV